MARRVASMPWCAFRKAGTCHFPTVVNVHGGPTFQDYDMWHTTTASLVDLGYATVNVNYRGSTGYGADWRNALKGRLGFIELEDITAVLDHLVAEGTVDPQRVSIAGGSWGGFVTLMALGTQPGRWRSGVALVPVADQLKSAEVSPPFMQAYLDALIGGTLEEARDQYVASSPISYVAMSANHCSSAPVSTTLDAPLSRWIPTSTLFVLWGAMCTITGSTPVTLFLTSTRWWTSYASSSTSWNAPTHLADLRCIAPFRGAE